MSTIFKVIRWDNFQERRRKRTLRGTLGQLKIAIGLQSEQDAQIIRHFQEVQKKRIRSESLQNWISALREQKVLRSLKKREIEAKKKSLIILKLNAD